MRSMLRRAALAAMVTMPFALGLVATPVAATSPTIVEVQLVRILTNTCPGFLIQATFHVDRRVTTFYDADGTAIRQTIHADLAGSFTQNVSTGYSIPIIGVRYIETNLLTGEVKSTGTNAHVLLPGLGTIQIGAGQTIMDGGQLVFDAGRLDPGGSPALCEALAG